MVILGLKIFWDKMGHFGVKRAIFEFRKYFWGKMAIFGVKSHFFGLNTFYLKIAFFPENSFPTIFDSLVAKVG